MSRPMPQITIKISAETLCGGIAASSQSFKTTPCLFSILVKKCGNNESMVNNITEPLRSLIILGEVLHASFHLSLTFKVMFCATVFN